MKYLFSCQLLPAGGARSVRGVEYSLNPCDIVFTNMVYIIIKELQQYQTLTLPIVFTQRDTASFDVYLWLLSSANAPNAHISRTARKFNMLYVHNIELKMCGNIVG
jgi:hypothetical protein